jgi:hypothetical protein
MYRFFSNQGILRGKVYQGNGCSQVWVSELIRDNFWKIVRPYRKKSRCLARELACNGTIPMGAVVLVSNWALANKASGHEGCEALYWVVCRCWCWRNGQLGASSCNPCFAAIVSGLQASEGCPLKNRPQFSLELHCQKSESLESASFSPPHRVWLSSRIGLPKNLISLNFKTDR